MSLFALNFTDAGAREELPEYQYFVNELNQKIQNVQTRSSCPGVQLAMNCGNGVCEPDKGENEINCPADCVVAPIRSYDSVVNCAEVKQVFTPQTAEEVQTIVREAAQKNLHLRVVGHTHSVNNQYCTDGWVISTEKLNQIIGLETSNQEETVTVQAGVTLAELTQWLHEHGKSLGYAVMGFEGITIGGAIATGAHGSSLHHPNIISSLVRSIQLVTAQGEIKEYSSETADPKTMKALRAHLGMLGAVVQIKLAVTSQFNLKVVVSHDDDKNLLKENGIWNQMNACDFGEMNWFPNTRKLIKICGQETQLPVDKNAGNSLLKPEVPKGLIKPYRLVLHYADCYPAINSLLEKIRYLMLKWNPPFQKEDAKGKLRATSKVVGYSHRMMSSRLISEYHGFFQTDWEVVLPLSEAQNAIRYISKYFIQNKISLPLVGVFMRFARADDQTLLAHTVSQGYFRKNEPLVFLEFPVSAPVGFPPEMENNYNRLFEDLIQTLLTRYHARAHWGKNKNWVFQLERELRSYGENLKDFQDVIEQLDPQGMFATEFSRAVGLTPLKNSQEGHPQTRFVN